MVRWFALLLLVSSLASLAPASAQDADPVDPSALVELATDPAGDPGVPAGADQFDLRGLAAAFDGDDLAVALTVTGFPDPAKVALVESAFYEVHFVHGDVPYLLGLSFRVFATSAVDGVDVDGALERWDGTDWRIVREDLDAVLVGDALTVRVPVATLVDADDLPPRPGTALAGFWVESTGEADSTARFGVGDDRPTVHDVMPDAGEAGATAALPFPAAPDDALLAFHTDAPVRASNGGPRTLVYNVTVRNESPDAADLPLVVTGAPETWTVRVVPDRVALEPGAEADVVVVVHAQGSHGHGGDDVFRLGVDGGGTAGIDLAVHYPETPQPAGHHDVLWFHATSQFKFVGPFAPVGDAETTAMEAAGFPTHALWMNTLEQDDADEGGEEVMRAWDDGAWRGWRIPLAPRLAVGLDLSDDPGAVVLSLSTTYDADLEGVVLRAVLRHDPGVGTSRSDLAVSEELGPFALSGGVTEVTLPLAALVDAVPHTPDARLWLDVEVVSSENGPESALGMVQPTLLPGGHARLPLGEYDDPIPAAVLAALRAEGVVDENGTLHAAPVVAASAGKDSPGPAPSLLVAGLAAAVLVVRRHRRGST